MIEHADTTFEIKSVNDTGHIEGLAAGIGDADHGRDTILPGAFTKTLEARRGRPLPMLLSHDLSRPIGVWTELTEQPDGLYVKGRMTLASPDAQIAYALARDGALSGLSIGYIAVAPQIHSTGRTLKTIDLHEASLVAVPMHGRARVADIKAICSAGDIADLLRERGISGRQAKAAAGLAWKAITATQASDEPDFEELSRILDESAARVAAL